MCVVATPLWQFCDVSCDASIFSWIANETVAMGCIASKADINDIHRDTFHVVWKIKTSTFSILWFRPNHGKSNSLLLKWVLVFNFVINKLYDYWWFKSTVTVTSSYAGLNQRFSTQITPRPVFYHDLQFLNIHRKAVHFKSLISKFNTSSTQQKWFLSKTLIFLLYL